MAIYGNLRDYRFEKDVDDIRGADVYGSEDDKLGTIDDVIFDSRSGELRYVVVDTGGWLTSRKFLVDALQLTIREEGDEDYYINMTKAQIERLPEYNEEKLSNDEQWTDYERRYSTSLTDGPVMHKEDSTRMITPDPSQVETYRDTSSAGTSRMTQGSAEFVDDDVDEMDDDDAETLNGTGDVTPRRIAQDQPRFGATSTSDSSPGERGQLYGNSQLEPVSERRGSRGRRFEDFQERLRRDREQILRRRAA
jgi:hypothetical protein